MFKALSNEDLGTITGGTDWQSVRKQATAGAIGGGMTGFFAGGAASFFGAGVGSIPGAIIGGVVGGGVEGGREYIRQNRQPQGAAPSMPMGAP